MTNYDFGFFSYKQLDRYTFNQFALRRFIWFVLILNFHWIVYYTLLRRELAKDEKVNSNFFRSFLLLFVLFRSFSYFFALCLSSLLLGTFFQNPFQNDALELQSTLLNLHWTNRTNSKNKWYLIISKWFFYWTICN